MNIKLITAIAGAVVAGGAIGFIFYKKKKAAKAEPEVIEEKKEEPTDEEESEEPVEEVSNTTTFENIVELIYYKGSNIFLDTSDEVQKELGEELSRCGFKEAIEELPETSHHVIMKMEDGTTYFIFLMDGEDPYTIMNKAKTRKTKAK